MKRDLKGVLLICLSLGFSLFPVLWPDPYLLHLLILFFLFAVLVSSWNILFGYMGIFCFGQQAFFGIGAYGSALFALKLGVPIPLAIVIGGILAMLSSLLIGLPSLRLRGAYVALVTLAFAEVMRMTCSNWVDVTRGQLGLTVPALIPGAGRIGYYYASFAAFLLGTGLLWKIFRSSFGYVTVAIRESQEASSSLGIDIVKYKLLAFMLSSFMAGIAGAFYGHYILILTPDIMGLHIMISILVMGMLGGLGTLEGPIVGTFVLIFLSEYLRGFGQFRFIIYGSLIILSVLFIPGGLATVIRLCEGIVLRKKSSQSLPPS
jgi:branched-chain amino acid transport system permease protein